MRYYLMSTGNEVWNHLEEPFVIAEVTDLAPEMATDEFFGYVGGELLSDLNAAKRYPGAVAAWVEGDDSTCLRNRELGVLVNELSAMDNELRLEG